MLPNLQLPLQKKIAQARWQEIAIELNSLPGAEKSWDKWKKVPNNYLKKWKIKI